MMQKNYLLWCLMIGTFFFSTATSAQTINFDETWKEFLENNKISNMSQLIRPDKVYDQDGYAKYLLMNTNSCFCQSEIEDAEGFMAEIQQLNPQVRKSIPKFIMKMEDLQTKIEAYHSMDAIWEQFLQNKKIDIETLDAVKAAKTVCEKRTLAKYSYMTAYAYFCQGNISRSKDILENRTLRLTEKTTLRVNDIKGMASEVAKMKSLFQDITKLDAAWTTYVKTGVSPGFDIELPLFPCNPTPNIKEMILRGAVDICNLAPVMLEKIKKLQAESSVALSGELKGKVKELEASIQETETDLAVLNKAWKKFIPNNEMKGLRRYGYKYCTVEPLVRAYIMDGFANVCERSGEMLAKIDSMRSDKILPLEEITMIKINELQELNEKYKFDQLEIERLWSTFVAQGDTLLEDYQLADFYCDNIHQVKSWVINGHMSSCEQSHLFLEQIDEFQRTFEFFFVKELECRVQNLRIKVWDCRHKALLKLARLETSPNSYEERLIELMEEYGMSERPDICSLDE